MDQRVGQDRTAETGSDAGEQRGGKKPGRDVDGEVQEFARGIEDQLVRGGVALCGEPEYGGSESGNDAVGFGLLIIKARDRA